MKQLRCNDRRRLFGLSQCSHKSSSDIWGSTVSFQGIELFLHSIPENNPKKGRKQDRKIIENQKICRNGMPKCTQTRKDIKVKANIQSPHLHSIVTKCGDGWGFLLSMCISDLYRGFIHPVDCLQTSWSSKSTVGVWRSEIRSWTDATSSQGIRAVSNH